MNSDMVLVEITRLLTKLGESTAELTTEIKRANDIHTRTLESLQAVLRDRGDEWWKE